MNAYPRTTFAAFNVNGETVTTHRPGRWSVAALEKLAARMGGTLHRAYHIARSASTGRVVEGSRVEVK